MSCAWRENGSGRGARRRFLVKECQTWDTQGTRVSKLKFPLRAGSLLRAHTGWFVENPVNPYL